MDGVDISILVAYSRLVGFSSGIFIKFTVLMSFMYQNIVQKTENVKCFFLKLVLNEGLICFMLVLRFIKRVCNV